MIKKKDLDIVRLGKIMKSVKENFKLTPKEKREFERMIFEEEMNRKYPPSFRTCGPGCPGLKKY